MYNEKELINALNMIQRVCENHLGKCKDCPLRNCDDDCGLLQSRDGVDILRPVEWIIKKPEDKPRVLVY